MSRTFDRRILSEPTLALVRACQRRAGGHLGGGAVLAGVHLRHRRTRDIDLFLHDPDAHRELVRCLPDVARETGARIEPVRDSGTFVRARVGLPREQLELDLVYEPMADIETPPQPVEGVVVESMADLRACKVTCLLSRSEPRDLVDLLFLDRAGWPVEADLHLALRKDAGIDPGVLAWLLGGFPVAPLPAMLVCLTEGELLAFRDALRERLRRLAVPE